MIVLVMGVSGVGKTAIGEKLALKLGWRFIEGDDFHSKESVAKMSAGVPLEDADRWPWLERIHAELVRLDRQGVDAVVACSALKKSYREKLLKNLPRHIIVHLYGSFELISERIKHRQHRYMPASLLRSQFDTLEPPADAIEVDISGSPEETVQRAFEAVTSARGK